MTRAVKAPKMEKPFQCFVCGNNGDHSEMCCGHPMIEIIADKYGLNWDSFDDAKRYDPEEVVEVRVCNRKG